MPAPDPADDDGWNHNIHYHRVVLEAVGPGCRTALDVGCGEGGLARRLAVVVPDVTALDTDAPTLERARAAGPASIHFVLGDVLTAELDEASFDLVATIAVLHHMDMAAGLVRMAALVRPGGTLVAIGLGRTTNPIEWTRDAVGLVASRWSRHRRRFEDVTAPTVWPPPLSHAECRAIAEDQLPGVIYRRHLYLRYSLTWAKPA